MLRLTFPFASSPSPASAIFKKVLRVGLPIAAISVATTAQAGSQLFEGSWIIKAFGNDCTRWMTGTSGGVPKFPNCTRETPYARYYWAFGIPQGIQCNPRQPRCNFSETPTDGIGNFAPLGGSQRQAVYCAPWANWQGMGTTARPAKGQTATTGGKNKRPIPPLYRNPGFFTASGAPNQTSCTPRSTDGFGGTGPVQLGHPITGMGVATSTRTSMGAMGGFHFPAAAPGSGPGLRATGVFGDPGFGELCYHYRWNEGCDHGDFVFWYPLMYRYTYATLRNDTGVFGPGNGLGDLSVKKKQGARTIASINVKQGAAKFGGTMRMLGAITSKTCYYRNGGCSLGENNWRYEAAGATGNYRSTGGQITKGYQAQTSAVYFNTALQQFSTVMVVGSRFGWTTGSVTVTATRGMNKTVHYAHGYDNRTTTYGKGTIQLVTPLLTQWLQPAANYETGGIGILKLKFVPEPRAWLMLAVGISSLVLFARRRR